MTETNDDYFDKTEYAIAPYFLDCTLTEGEIRERIRNILKMPDGEYLCHACFCFVGKNYNEEQICPDCYEMYCAICTEKFKYSKTGRIDATRCPNCIANKQFAIKYIKSK
jgi:hypothetical protein